MVSCCVVKDGLVTLVVIVILEDIASFQVLFIVSLSCAWNVSNLEINSGVFTHFKDKSVEVTFTYCDTAGASCNINPNLKSWS